MKINIKKIIIFLVVVLVFRLAYKIYVYNYKYEEWKNKKIVVDIYDIEKIEQEKKVYKIKYNNDFFLLNVDNEKGTFKVGDRVTILSSNYNIKRYNNPYEFNYKRYLNSKNIVSVIYCNKVLIHETGKNKIITAISYIRNKISEKLDTKLNNKESNLIKSFMYGEDTYLDEALKNKFIDIGLGHILCVSGAHVSSLLFIFEKMTKSKKKNIFNIVLLLYFYIISLFKLSLLRPILMYIISFTFKKIEFNLKLFLSFILILVINPYYIFNIGIIFSFLSVLSIKLFYSIINSWLSIKIAKKNKAVSFIISNISLTLSSQILILPFQVYFFQKMSLISIFSNVLICFILNIFMYSIFALFILFFIPIISDIILYICSNIVYLIVFQVEMLYSINYFNITFTKPNILVFISFYLCVIIILYKKLIIVYFWKYRKKLKSLAEILKYMCIVYIFFWYICTMFLEKYVIYFNVGQGNMALLHFHTTNIIVDAGSTKENIAGNIMSTYLKAKNIKNIDLVLLTHMHADHINGIEQIINNGIEIKRIGYTKPYKEAEEYLKLKSILKENNIGIIELIEKDNIKINGIEIDILSPPIDHYIKDNDMLNANSTVYLISRKLNNYLFMGDSTKNTEKYILNNYIKSNENIEIKEKLKNIRIYQVSHHGSKTSSYEEFIKEIASKNAIFSAQKSVYGHPNDEILELFKKYNYIIYLTEKNGAIKL